jgi:hypothetical protein
MCVKCNRLMVEHEKIKDDIHEIEWVCINCEARVSP